MIECTKCNWYGEPDELVCSDADNESSKPTTQIRFNLCPRCKGKDFEDSDEDENDNAKLSG